MRQEVPVAIVQLDHARDLPLPDYATVGSAGVDLTAAVTEPITIAPGERLLVPTGLAIALPDGFEAQVRPRSGLALKHGVTVLNSPGTIDADYRGEVKVIMFNASGDPFVVSRGMRIAQMVVAPVSRLQWQAVDQLPASNREAGGFGSTGLG
jgi:dUTP pyrophosphatase